MNVYFYNYYFPFRNLFTGVKNIVCTKKITEFEKYIKSDENGIFVLPVTVFDLVGFDIKFFFRTIGFKPKQKFILLGSHHQIEQSLTQNDKFLKNAIYEIRIPMEIEYIEMKIIKTIDQIKEKLK